MGHPRKPRDIYRRFEIDAEKLRLRIGDRVMPATEVGIDAETGELMTAGCHGKVTGVRFNPINRSFLVMVQGRLEIDETTFSSSS